MAKSIEDWIEQDVDPIRERPITWITQEYFFRDPARPLYSDVSHFFSPADGIILYQQIVDPAEGMVEIKGRLHSLRDALRNDRYDKRSLVIGIFMTMYDVHVNRIPYRGRLSYRELEPVDSYNYPMLSVEKSLLDDLRIDLSQAEYLHNNQRMLNTIVAPDLAQAYYILQIADYDVSCITPFELKQNWPVEQNGPFSMVRFGSQVDLLLPLNPNVTYELTQETGVHVEAGVDTLIRVDGP
jgi:phosphatidylserine decarboxylase